MQIQNLVTVFVILCESCNVMNYDVRIYMAQKRRHKKWYHTETLFADNIIL